MARFSTTPVSRTFRHCVGVLILTAGVITSCATAPKKLQVEESTAPTAARAPSSVKTYGPASPQAPGSDQGAMSGNAAPSRAVGVTYQTVRFGTNRKVLETGRVSGPSFFDSSNGGKLLFGTIRISIDANRSPGDLRGVHAAEPPTMQDEKRYLRELRTDIARSKEKKLLIFVHGYNVTFEKAARRTAQLKHDLAFDGEAAFFSWPSRGNLLGYWSDEHAVETAQPYLEQFLTTTIKKSGAKNIYIIAHSMGNRAFTAVYPRVREALHGAQSVKEIVLAAPDIDAKVFTDKIAPAMRSKSNGTTIYCSGRDKALWGSWLVHGFARRLGQRPVELDDTESIDASSVDTRLLGLGHSYYGDQFNLLEDLRLLIKGLRPPQRSETLEAIKQKREAWLLRKELIREAGYDEAVMDYVYDYDRGEYVPPR